MSRSLVPTFRDAGGAPQAGSGMFDAYYLEQVSFQNVAGEKEKSKLLK
jgi:hypothetical protein